VLIHDYAGVDMAAVADVLQTHLPELIRLLEATGAGDTTE